MKNSQRSSYVPYKEFKIPEEKTDFMSQGFLPDFNFSRRRGSNDEAHKNEEKKVRRETTVDLFDGKPVLETDTEEEEEREEGDENVNPQNNPHDSEEAEEDSSIEERYQRKGKDNEDEVQAHEEQENEGNDYVSSDEGSDDNDIYVNKDDELLDKKILEEERARKEKEEREEREKKEEREEKERREEEERAIKEKEEELKREKESMEKSRKLREENEWKEESEKESESKGSNWRNRTKSKKKELILDLSREHKSNQSKKSMKNLSDSKSESDESEDSMEKEINNVDLKTVEKRKNLELRRNLPDGISSIKRSRKSENNKSNFLDSMINAISDINDNSRESESMSRVLKSEKKDENDNKTIVEVPEEEEFTTTFNKNNRSSNKGRESGKEGEVNPKIQRKTQRKSLTIPDFSEVKSKSSSNEKDNKVPKKGKKRVSNKAKKGKKSQKEEEEEVNSNFDIEEKPRKITSNVYENNDENNNSNKNNSKDIDNDNNVNNYNNNDNYQENDYYNNNNSEDSAAFVKKPKKKNRKSSELNEEIKPKKKKKATKISNKDVQFRKYLAQKDTKLIQYDFVEDKNRPKTFGVNGRYSLRNRIRTLDHANNERAIYTYDENGGSIVGIYSVRESYLTLWNDFNHQFEEKAKKVKEKRRKLVTRREQESYLKGSKSSQNSSQESIKRYKEIPLDDNFKPGNLGGKRVYVDDLINEKKKFDFDMGKLKKNSYAVANKKRSNKNADEKEDNKLGDPLNTLITINPLGTKENTTNLRGAIKLKIKSASGKNILKIGENNYIYQVRAGDEFIIDNYESYVFYNFSENNLEYLVEIYEEE